MNSCILILSFNHPNITASLIDSILKKTTGKDIYLLHNGSRPEVVSELKNKFTSIKHLELEVNKGYTGGVNWGLKNLFNQYDWVYFFTNDTLLESLSHSLPSKIGFYGPQIFRRKLDKIDSLGGRFNPWLKKIWHCKSEKEFFQFRLLNYRYLPGTAFLLHRDVFNMVGDFDESLHTYWEDVDFSMRCHQNKIPVGLVSDWKIIHKVGRTCHKDEFYTKKLFWENRETISKRYRKIFL